MSTRAMCFGKILGSHRPILFAFFLSQNAFWHQATVIWKSKTRFWNSGLEGATKAQLPGTASKNTDEIVLNGKTYWQVHLHHIYSVSASRSSVTQSLVDHGANGGIGGSDLWVIYKTHHSVDIQGIYNHQMINIPIATVGGVINTQHGEMIAIMHQYAYTGLGTSINSSAQLEKLCKS